MEDRGTLTIDGWQIDADLHRISRDGVEIKLEPRSMELLIYLAGRPGEVVSREEIEENIWHGQVVGYEALSGSIAKLRKAFGDTGKNHRIIETISKSGYRLIAPVMRASQVPDSTSEAIEVSPLSSKNSRLIVAVMVLAIIATALSWWQPWNERDGSASNDHIPFLLPDRPSIAVLPFTNMSGDPEQGYFADGMTDDLITDLSKISGLFVIARNSAFTYKDKSVNIQQVAEELGVKYVLEGSVRRAGEQIRINAQLIDASTSGHLWAERYDGDIDDVFALQDKITQKIVTALSINLTPEEERQRVQKYTDNVRAYDAYLQSRQIRALNSSEEFDSTINYLKKAIELDPTFGLAHATLAELYLDVGRNERTQTVGLTWNTANVRARSYVKEALKYPTPLAHRVHSVLLAQHGHWEEAISEARLAIELNPNDAEGYSAMFYLLIKMGRPAEANVYLKEAMRFDPKNQYSSRQATVKFHLEKYEEAAEILQICIDYNPDGEWFYLMLGASYGHLGREAEGKDAILKFDELRAKKGHRSNYKISDVDDWIFQDDASRERIRVGLRKAGMS